MAKNEAIQKGFHHHPIPVNGSSDHLMYRQKFQILMLMIEHRTHAQKPEGKKPLIT